MGDVRAYPRRFVTALPRALLFSRTNQLLNCVRLPNGEWRITDLDGARTLGEEIDDTKDLSTSIIPPEMTVLLENGDVALRVRQKVKPTSNPAPYEPLTAQATFDIWSIMVMLFPFLGR